MIFRSIGLQNVHVCDLTNIYNIKSCAKNTPLPGYIKNTYFYRLSEMFVAVVSFQLG